MHDDCDEKEIIFGDTSIVLANWNQKSNSPFITARKNRTRKAKVFILDSESSD